MSSPPDPGLDLSALRARRGVRRDLRQISSRIHEHLDAYRGFVSFSGGKDSTVVVDLARRVDPDVPVVWFDSGMEFPETRAYIADLAQRWNLNLFRLSSTPSGLDVLAASGAWDFDAEDQPTPGLHEVLIGAPSRAAHTAHGPGSMWGVRAAEAKGRAALYRAELGRRIAAECTQCCSGDRRSQRLRHGGTIHRRDGTVTYGPIWDWSDEEVWTYLASREIPANPIYDRLRALGADEGALRVGALIDGNQIERGRVTWLQKGWPELFEELAERLPRLRSMT